MMDTGWQQAMGMMDVGWQQAVGMMDTGWQQAVGMMDTGWQLVGMMDRMDTVREPVDMLSNVCGVVKA